MGFDVADVPVVSLKMGSSLNPDDIKEGDDVYFECNIRANPKAYRLAWFHNVSISYGYDYCSCFCALNGKSIVIISLCMATPASRVHVPSIQMCEI